MSLNSEMWSVKEENEMTVIRTSDVNKTATLKTKTPTFKTKTKTLVSKPAT